MSKKHGAPKHPKTIKARDFAVQLLKYERKGDKEGFERYLAVTERACRESGTSLTDTSAYRQMRAANERWQAVYKAYRARNGDTPPPVPFYWSLPYLTVLRMLLAQRAQMSAQDFWSRIVALENEISSTKAVLCVTFKEEFMAVPADDFDNDLVLEHMAGVKHSGVLNDTLTQYLAQGSFS